LGHVTLQESKDAGSTYNTLWENVLRTGGEGIPQNQVNFHFSDDSFAISGVNHLLRLSSRSASSTSALWQFVVQGYKTV